MQGSKPAARRLAQPPQHSQCLARGGVVRGPGTGTSDSIATEAEPGTFIMPADSTKAIGPAALAKLGTMPVRLSDGEFEIPPEQVMALGAAVLKLMKDATHKPVNGEDGGQTDAEVGEGEAEGGGEEMGEGAAHEQAEAAAGGVEDDSEEGAQGFQPGARERMARMPMFADGGLVDPRRPNSFGDAAAVAADPSVTQVRTSAADTFGSASAPAPAAAPVPAVGSNLAAATRMGAYTDPRSTLYDPNPFAASNAAKIAAAGQSSRATIEAGMPPAPAPATASNSFGDAAAATNDASVTQLAGGQPSTGTVSTVPAQPLSAAASTTGAQGVGYQSAAQRMATAAPAPADPLGWSDRNAQRNQEVSLSSIANRPEWQKAPQRAPDVGAAPPIPQPSGPTPLTQQVSQMPSTFQSKAAYGFQPRRYADGGMVEDDLQKRLAQIPVGGPPGWNGGGQSAAPVAAPPVAPTASAPAPAPAGALSRAASMATPPAPEPAAQPLSALADSTAQPTVRSMDAADGLARRGAADALARMPNAPAPIQAPTIRHSGNDWQARKDLENARTSALSIMNRPEWSNSGMNRFRGGQAGPSTDVAAYQAMLSNDLALRGAQPGLDQAAMRENADLQRAGLQTAAQAAEGTANRQNDLTRTLIGERGANQRATISALGTTEAARIKAAQENKAPAGYRYTVGGNMEPIPGGPADLKASKDGMQQVKDTQDIFSILNEARPLLASATGSYGGVALDKTAQAFGVATDGAKASAQLKALEGALISKMPKMSGPQSDKDVLLYKQMAGQIGDPTIPIEQRRAAMSTIENLNVKYLPAVTDAAGYDAVPAGSYYRTPTGDVRRKS